MATPDIQNLSLDPGPDPGPGPAPPSASAPPPAPASAPAQPIPPGFPPIGALQPITKEWVNHIYSELSKNDSVDPGQLDTIWNYIQNDTGECDRRQPPAGAAVFSSAQDGSNHARLANLEQYFRSDTANAIAPAEPLDLHYPISSYFISSSHNTYLSGNQFSSMSSADEYKNALRRGCRCVEVDVWDGDSDSDSDSDCEPENSTDHAPAHPRRRDAFKRLFRSKNKDGQPQHEAKGSPPSAAPSAGPTARKGIEPVVYHGYTMTSKITFRSVCETLMRHAFEFTDLPLIVSLEVHTSHEQQQMMVDIINSVFNGYLIDEPDDQDHERALLPTLAELRNKILIKVKYTAPQKAKERAARSVQTAGAAVAKGKRKSSALPAGADATRLDESETDESEEPLPFESSIPASGSGPDSAAVTTSTVAPTAPAPPKKPAKIIEALGRLGYYTRSFHFHSFAQPEAQIPTHIFSLSEGTVADMHKKDPLALWRHNCEFMMRSYPKATRLSSSNLDPILFWRRGIQIVALNWQKHDKGVMINEGMFTGTPGWVLKPDYFRALRRCPDEQAPGDGAVATGDHPTTPAQMWCSMPPSQRPHTLPDHTLVTLDLKITFYCGQDIPIPTDDKVEDFKPYIKCQLHVENEPVAVPGTGGTITTAGTTGASAPATASLGRGQEASSSLQSSTQQPPSSSAASSSVIASATTYTPIKQRIDRIKIKNAPTTSPSFGAQVAEWRDVSRVLPELAFLRIKVKDADRLSSDDLAAWACVRLDRLREGYRFLRLYNDRCEPTPGFLFVKVEKRMR